MITKGDQSGEFVWGIWIGPYEFINLQVEQWCPVVIPKGTDGQEVCTIPSDSAFPNCGSKVKVSLYNNIIINLPFNRQIFWEKLSPQLCCEKLYGNSFHA